MDIDEAIKKIKIKLKQTESFLNRLKKRNEACYVEDLPLYMHWTEEDKKATEILFNEYNNLKQIEEAHKNENGELRTKINELEREIEGLKQTFIIHDDIDNHIPHID